MNLKQATILRAYDYAHPEPVRDAVENGQHTNRGRFSFLGEPVHREVRDLLKKGFTTKEIAERAGCSENTVRRELEKINSRS